MSDFAFQKQYRQEIVKGFEKRQSLARRTVTTETVIKGNEAIFLVADSGGATATTRGPNGDIPSRPDNNNQYTCTLEEKHDVVEKNRFNIFASQGNQVMVMQQSTQAVLNRTIDIDIHTALATASVTWGAAAVATLALVGKAKTKLGNAFALMDAPVWALITPAFHAYLMALTQFASADYISDKKFDGVSTSQAFAWYGVNWIVDAGLPGVGTASATCFMYSQAAIGHAMDMDRLDTVLDYEKRHDRSYCRTTGYFGSKLLQNAGVVKMLHDDSAMS
jgi:hypothetical protein